MKLLSKKLKPDMLKSHLLQDNSLLYNGKKGKDIKIPVRFSKFLGDKLTQIHIYRMARSNFIFSNPCGSTYDFKQKKSSKKTKR